jgi:hypothetical protein
MAPLGSKGVSASPFDQAGESYARSDLSGGRGGRAAALRRLCGSLEESLVMLMILLYAAGGIGIAIYMIAALLRPEKF